MLLMKNDVKWSTRFLDLADHVASWSKDPSRKIGAVIVRPDRTIVSVGYNGFPRGVDDSPERYEDRSVKYSFVCHAEMNAITSSREALHDCTLYVSPLYPCKDCAKMIIQCGIRRVVTRMVAEKHDEFQFDAAQTMFKEAAVMVWTEQENVND